ncbi:MAG TPA: hypothetical protein VEQ59_06330 [Polyangiaceae bacterium]|nr:hypothetical protein [Polyangiaceae bacterium]
MSDRYARQQTLASVGEAGQQRIVAATYVVSGAAEPSATVEREYLRRAGARNIVASGEPAAAFAHAAVFRAGPARDFAAGAWRALVQLRSALEPNKTP